MKFSFPKPNQVILVIIISEFIVTTGVGLVTPIYAIFVTQEVFAATATVVGFSVALYWLVKSILQLPIARYIDKNHGEIDDYYSMLIGVFLAVVATFLFYFATKIWHVYVLQIMLGVADSFAVPPFYAIFTRHIDKDNEGFEWALRSSFSLGAGAALGGFFSGILAALVSFRIMFLINSGLTFIGFLILLFLRPYIRPRVSQSVERVFIEQKRL
ncbi:MFS transporter [Patescibacteria group bacterium]|nr:MFS transporter [Patescibacteria group bacterium]